MAGLFLDRSHVSMWIYMSHSSMSCFSSVLNQLKWHNIDYAYEDESNPGDIRMVEIL